MGRCPEVAGRSAEASASAQHGPTWLTAEALCKMHLYSRLWIFTFLLQAASALEIEDIQMPRTRFDVNEGDRLLIPCSFKADEGIQASNLRLEWGVITEPSGSYRPIYRVVGSVLEPVTEPNPYEGRAQMFISLIPKGNCSLVLQPVLARDAGQYELRLYSQGEVTVNGQKVVVAVHGGKASSSPKETKKGTASVKDRLLEGQSLDTCREFSNFDKRLMTLTKDINSVTARTGVSTLGLEIIAGVVIGILLAGSVAGILLWKHAVKCVVCDDVPGAARRVTNAVCPQLGNPNPCVFLDGGRKPENPEETHVIPERVYKILTDCSGMKLRSLALCRLYKGLKALRKEKSRRRKCRKYCQKSKHRRSHSEDPVTRQEEEVFQVETPEPTMSSSLEQCEYQMASDTN